MADEVDVTYAGQTRKAFLVSGPTSGSPTSIPDGGDVAQGSLADTAAAAVAPITTAPFSVIALLKGIYNLLLRGVPASTEYETVAASQADQILGATGAVGDFLSGLLIVPATTSPGAVSIKDGNGSAITVFTGGAASVSNLVPFIVPLGIKCIAATTPGWKVTTGANVSVIGCGDFT